MLRPLHPSRRGPRCRTGLRTAEQGQKHRNSAPGLDPAQSLTLRIGMSPKLGDRLVAAGLVSREAVDQALEQQRLTGHRLGDSLVEMGLLGEAALLRFLASELKTRYVPAEKLSRAQIPSDLLDRVPVRLAEEHQILPLAVSEERRLPSLRAAAPPD